MVLCRNKVSEILGRSKITVHPFSLARIFLELWESLVYSRSFLFLILPLLNPAQNLALAYALQVHFKMWFKDQLLQNHLGSLLNIQVLVKHAPQAILTRSKGWEAPAWSAVVTSPLAWVPQRGSALWEATCPHPSPPPSSDHLLALVPALSGDPHAPLLAGAWPLGTRTFCSEPNSGPSFLFFLTFVFLLFWFSSILTLNLMISF